MTTLMHSALGHLGRTPPTRPRSTIQAADAGNGTTTYADAVAAKAASYRLILTSGPGDTGRAVAFQVGDLWQAFHGRSKGVRGFQTVQKSSGLYTGTPQYRPRDEQYALIRHEHFGYVLRRIAALPSDPYFVVKPALLESYLQEAALNAHIALLNAASPGGLQLQRHPSVQLGKNLSDMQWLHHCLPRFPRVAAAVLRIGPNPRGVIKEGGLQFQIRRHVRLTLLVAVNTTQLQGLKDEPDKG